MGNSPKLQKKHIDTTRRWIHLLVVTIHTDSVGFICSGTKTFVPEISATDPKQWRSMKLVCAAQGTEKIHFNKLKSSNSFTKTVFLLL